jgi:L-aminopeptidase/D-esterase-like protein
VAQVDEEGGRLVERKDNEASNEDEQRNAAACEEEVAPSSIVLHATDDAFGTAAAARIAALMGEGMSGERS